MTGVFGDRKNAGGKNRKKQNQTNEAYSKRKCQSMAYNYKVMAHMFSAYYVTDVENNKNNKLNPFFFRTSGSGEGEGDSLRKQLFCSP